MLHKVEKEGTGMLVGFLLLFMIGVILSAVINMAGAVQLQSIDGLHTFYQGRLRLKSV